MHLWAHHSTASSVDDEAEATGKGMRLLGLALVTAWLQDVVPGLLGFQREEEADGAGFTESK